MPSWGYPHTFYVVAIWQNCIAAENFSFTFENLCSYCSVTLFCLNFCRSLTREWAKSCKEAGRMCFHDSRRHSSSTKNLRLSVYTFSGIYIYICINSLLMMISLWYFANIVLYLLFTIFIRRINSCNMCRRYGGNLSNRGFPPY